MEVVRDEGRVDERWERKERREVRVSTDWEGDGERGEGESRDEISAVRSIPL